MDIFDLDQQEIEVLYLRMQNLTPTQIQVRLNISSSEFHERQKTAFTKLDIPGEPKEKWGNFVRSNHADIVSKLTDDDIKNWYQERENLRKRFAPAPNRRWLTLVLYGVGALAILLVGILAGRALFSPPATPLSTSEPSLEASPATPVSPIPSGTAPVPATQTQDSPTMSPTDTIAPTMTLTLTAPPTTPPPTETKSPLGLGIGDELRDDRVTLKLIDVRYNEGYDRVGGSVAPVSYVFEYTNHSGQTLVVQFNKSNFIIEDNTGRTAECWFFLSPFTAFDAWTSNLTDNATVLITARCGLNRLPEDVTTYELTIHPFTSLPESTWIVDVPR